MRPRLVAINPIDRKTREFRLAKGEVTVGSGEGNSLTLREDRISRSHAVIRYRAGQYVLRDLESTNGTFVNNQRVRGDYILKDGDRVRFGSAPFVFLDPRPARTKGKRRLSFVRMVELLAVLFVVGFGLTEYQINRRFVAQSIREFSHLGTTASTATPKAEPRPSVAEAANAKPSTVVSPQSAATPEAPVTSASDWLGRINSYRAMVKLAAVRADPELSNGCLSHARYLTVNYAEIIKGGGAFGGAGHDEEPAKKGYTDKGEACARNGDVAWGCGPFNGADAVDHWMEGPFHRFGILNPNLDRAGFGEVENKNDGCWAAAVRLPPYQKYEKYEHPIEFPPDGATVALEWGGGEWPDPLEGCPGYAEPIGLPITIQLGRGFHPQLSDHSLTENGQLVEDCAYDARGSVSRDGNLQEYARQVLHSFSAIVLIPRKPLVPGKTYAVSVTAQGETYSWSFKTVAGGN